jgi:hypothetical protein
MRATPRYVRLSGAGIVVLIVAASLILGALLGGVEFYRRAKLADRHVALFASEGISTGARVVRVQRRGGGNDRRSTVHYRYVVGDREHAGETTVRRVDRDRYEAGSRMAVRYLSSEPHTSWMEGYPPQHRPIWPGFVFPAAAIFGALAMAALIRRQTFLLTYGRPAVATVTKVEKKRSDKGTFWRVHYEWTLLSGGKRQGRYNHGKKQPPEVGATIPIVYDRDQPVRHNRYPLSLVALSESRK